MTLEELELSHKSKLEQSMPQSCSLVRTGSTHNYRYTPYNYDIDSDCVLQDADGRDYFGFPLEKKDKT